MEWEGWEKILSLALAVLGNPTVERWGAVVSTLLQSGGKNPAAQGCWEV